METPSESLNAIPNPSTGGFTRRQLRTIAIVGCNSLLSGTVIRLIVHAIALIVVGKSILAPFYPEEGKLKGATPWEVGVVFGIFHLVMFIASPLFGILLGRVPPKRVFSAGVVLYGITSVSFGFLSFVENRTTFVALSIILRVMQSLGHSANCAAGFTLITLEFPKTFTTMFASLETTWGVGMIIGPTAGGVLYELGGFPLPFLTTGGLVLLIAVISCIFLPLPPTSTSNSSGAEQGQTTSIEDILRSTSSAKGFGFMSLVGVPGVALAGLAVCVSSASIGFLQATFEPFLKEKFNVTPMYTGFIFMIDGLVYCLAAPIWGRICEKWVVNTKFITLAGCIFTFAGFLLIGPAPGIPFEPILWVTCVGMSIHGIGVGASFVSSFLQGVQESLADGFPDSVSTYGLVSGLWLSFLALGSFIGPCIGGLLVAHFTFELSSLFVLVLQIVMGSATVLFILFQGKGPKDATVKSGTIATENSDQDANNDRTPLLAPSGP